MAESLAGRPGRGGATISESGEESVLGFWPEHLDSSKAGWVGIARQKFGDAVNVVQKLHEQNRSVIEAKALGKVAALPEPHVRLKLAQSEWKKLDAVENSLSTVDGQIFDKGLSLKPWDYEAEGVAGVVKRGELRTLLRGMKPEDRAAALKQGAFRAAVLEQPALASALAQSEYDMLHQSELAAKFPQDMENLAHAREGVGTARLALKAARRALENEMRAVGATSAVEAPPPPASKSWA